MKTKYHEDSVDQAVTRYFTSDGKEISREEYEKLQGSKATGPKAGGQKPKNLQQKDVEKEE